MRNVRSNKNKVARAKHIILCAGINNLARKQAPEYVAATYAPLLKTLRSLKVNVTVLGIPLVVNYANNQVIKAANKSLAIVCDIFGAKFVSTSPMFHQDGKFRRDIHSRDNYHLRPEGYQMFADLVKSAMSPNSLGGC